MIFSFDIKGNAYTIVLIDKTFTEVHALVIKPSEYTMLQEKENEIAHYFRYFPKELVALTERNTM